MLRRRQRCSSVRSTAWWPEGLESEFAQSSRRSKTDTKPRLTARANGSDIIVLGLKKSSTIITSFGWVEDDPIGVLRSYHPRRGLMNTRMTLRRSISLWVLWIGVACFALAGLAPTLASAQPGAATGVISGGVTADRGTVAAFRVKARHTDQRIAYTVYTVGGRYQSSTSRRAPTRCG